MKARVIILVALLSVLSMGRAEAQRCLPKMQGIELRAGLNEADGYVLGAALSSYAKGGDKWVYGVEYLQTNHGYRSTTIPAAQFTAEGGARLNNKDAFVYGCAATLEMELYLADFIALTASLRERFLWGGSMGVCHTEYGIGVKFIIN